MKKYLFSVAILIVSVISAFSQAEEKFDFYTRGDYRAEVPRPQSILRYDVGDHHTTYGQMEQVITAIAKAAADRVKIYEIGTTNEHRMQYLVAISSPENMARIDAIRENVARLTDPRKTSPADARAIAESTPAIAWMAYTIHGNESSSFEAMMQVIYQLAASNEPTTMDILKNTVVLVLTGENPDGHERFATWYNSVAIGSPDRFAVEHREPWSIFGRLNHYRFNLNRDTLAMTQKETRNMIAAYNQWNPQLAVDHHGQPSQFFFPPVALPINPNLPQPMYNNWLDKYGRANAAAFDKNHWDYYVRDVFDAFFMGYWDTYPSVNGAIGMTFETDGGGFKGLRWTRDDGTIVTFRSSIAKHFVASMTTLETTAKNKTDRLMDFYNFRAGALKDYSKGKMKRVVILPESDRAKSAELIEVLRRSKIEVKQARAAFTSSSAHTYMEKDSRPVSKTFPAGAFIVELDQPQRILIKSILEPDTPQDKAFVDDNMARFNRNQMRGKGQPKEEYGFYDLTAWSLPLAFGVEAWWTEDAGNVSSEALMDQTLAAVRRGTVSGRAQVAYVIPYDSDAAGAMALKLVQKGFRVAVANRQLNAGGRNWDRGTFVVRISRNPETIHETISDFAREMGVNVIAVNSGFSDEGDTSIGGEAVNSLQAAKVAVAIDDGLDVESFGSIWWTFDQYGIEFTPMTITNVRGGGLKDYNVLILPDGSAGRYFGAFGPGGVARLKEWVAAGGTLITIRGASVFAALKDVALTSSKLVGSEDDDQKAKPVKEQPEPSPAASPAPARAEKRTAPSPTTPEPPAETRSERSPLLDSSLPPIASPSADANKVPEFLPGSIMRATVDRTVYLNYGVNQDEIPVLLASGFFFRYSKEGTNALVFDAEPKKPLTVSGFVWEGNTENLLKGTAYLMDEKMGQGHVILFAEDPFYRGLYRSVTRQFFNSVLFNGMF